MVRKELTFASLRPTEQALVSDMLATGKINILDKKITDRAAAYLLMVTCNCSEGHARGATWRR